MIIYATLTHDTKDEISADSRLKKVAAIRISVIGNSSDITLRNIIPAHIRPYHILNVVAYLGVCGWVCLPIGDSLSAFWCYRNVENQMEKDGAIEDIERMLNPLEEAGSTGVLWENMG